MTHVYSKLITGILLFTFISAQSQNKPAYRLYDSKGKKVKYDKMLSDL